MSVAQNLLAILQILKNEAVRMKINKDLEILEGGNVGIGIYPKEYEIGRSESSQFKFWKVKIVLISVPLLGATWNDPGNGAEFVKIRTNDSPIFPFDNVVRRVNVYKVPSFKVFPLKIKVGSRPLLPIFPIVDIIGDKMLLFILAR